MQSPNIGCANSMLVECSNCASHALSIGHSGKADAHSLSIEHSGKADAYSLGCGFSGKIGTLANAAARNFIPHISRPAHLTRLFGRPYTGSPTTG